MSTLNACPMCGEEAAKNADACPKCGEKLRLNGVQPHSGPAIASFILAVPGSITLLGSFGFIVYLMAHKRGGGMPQFGILEIVSLAFWASLGLLLIAAVLGLVGVLLPNRKKRFAILGLVFSLVAVGVVVWGGTVTPFDGITRLLHG